MKATGIVRRIDDLGRVVIPKEIRRTMRIREGDPLEIFTDADGEVVFKKYSPVGELTPFATQYADVMSRACGLGVLICDRDHVVAAAGISKRDYQDRRISGQMEDLMQARQTHVAKAGDRQRLQPVDGLSRYAGVMAPILASGDIVGAVCLMLPESGAVPGDGEIKLTQIAAGFLGKQMEE
ncbi:MAG: stage V sporulation T C-terminal domain-containing protein [Acutalibacteraceae bacterium]|jgi:AbrB family transcriptional regulator (stage V sporulation protein T)